MGSCVLLRMLRRVGVEGVVGEEYGESLGETLEEWRVPLSIL